MGGVEGEMGEPLEGFSGVRVEFDLGDLDPVGPGEYGRECGKRFHTGDR